MVYYVEYVFAENLIIDFILLFVTGKLLKRVIVYKRLLASSAIGALYVVLVAYIGRDFMTYFIVKVSVSVLMIMVAFDSRGILTNIRVIICFYMTSLIMAGIITAMYYMNYDRLTVNAIIIALFAGYAGLHFFFGEVKSRNEKSNYMRSVTVSFADKTKVLNAFIDTGNELSDPMTGKPVIVVNIECLRSILGEELYGRILNMYAGNEGLEVLLSEFSSYNLRIIRYNTISSKGERMVTITPDKVEVRKDSNHILNTDAVIGIYPGKISRKEDYDALLFNKILKWEMEQNNEPDKFC